MPNIVIPPVQSYCGFNPWSMVGFKIRYDSNGGGAAGTYTASVVLPPYAYLIDVALVGVTLWTGSSTIGVIVGDGDDDNGFFTTANLKATDLLAGEAISVNAGTAMAGGLIGAYVANSAWAVGGGTTNARYSTSARTITALVTAAGTATAGETHFLVSYAIMSGSLPLGAPVYAAS